MLATIAASSGLLLSPLRPAAPLRAAPLRMGEGDELGGAISSTFGEIFGSFFKPNAEREAEIDRAYAEQLEVAEQRRRGGIDGVASRMRATEERRAKESAAFTEKFAWQQGADPLSAFLKRRDEGKVKKIGYEDEPKGGIPMPMASFGVGGEFGTGGKYDNGERFDLRLPYVDQGYEDPDADVMGIVETGAMVRRLGKEMRYTHGLSRIPAITVSVSQHVPKPHTPFQWASQLDHESTDARLAKLKDAIRSDREYGKAIGLRYHDGKPGIVEGLLSRGDRRVGRVIENAWRAGARFDGWSEHFSFDRWMECAQSALSDEGVDVDWFTTRERDRTEVLPWEHLDSGLDSDWLWDDWQDALEEIAVDDCRWTPCFDCGVCDQMDTHIQVGPTGVTELPMPGIGVPACATPLATTTQSTTMQDASKTNGG